MDTPPFLYHGSVKPDLTFIEPRMRTRRAGQQEPRVYVTPSTGLAAIFIIPWTDKTARLGERDGQWIFEPLLPQVQDICGSIYEVQGDFTPVDDGRLEQYSTTTCRVHREIKIDSAFAYAQAHGVIIIPRTR